MSLTEESRTFLKLVLARGKSYAEIAALLGIDEREARERAHAALAELAEPGEAAPSPELADYLLGQADELSAAAARREIEADPDFADRVELLEEQLTLVTAAGARPSGARAAANGSAAPVGPREPAAAAPATPAAATPPASGPTEPAPPSEARSGQLTAAQRRLVAVLLGAALLAAILVLVLTGVIGGSGGDDDGTEANPAPTTATLRAVKGESGEGTAQIGFNSEGALATNLQINDLKPNRKNESYALWLYGSRGAFPVDRSRVDSTGAIAHQVPLNEAVICLIAADVFPELRLSRVSDVELARALRQARRANGGSGKIPDYVGRTVLTGRISMPQEAKDKILPNCSGAAAQANAG